MIDWPTAIRRQRRDLLTVVLALVAMLSGAGGSVVARRVYLAILEELRPAESAARRLIEILAHGMVVTPGPPRTAPAGPIARGTGKRVSVFSLFDPRTHPKPPEGCKSAPGPGPSVIEIGVDRHVAAPPRSRVSPDDMVDAQRVAARIAALKAALDDLPKQARRLARMYARGKAKWLRVMRPGRPPGHREGGTRLVDEVLRDCQWLALERLREPVPP